MLGKTPLGFEEAVELTTPDEGHDEEETEIAHEEVLHTHKELVLTFEHDVFFQFRIFDLVIFD